MKKITKLFALVLALAMVFTLASCGGGKEKSMVYAVEAGSAGEALAQENGWEINSVDSQARALMEVDAGTSDAAVIDLLMAGPGGGYYRV